MKVHHTALVTRNIDAATRFYRDGLGLELTFEITPEADFATLFGAHSNRLHSIFLSDPDDDSAGILELVEFEGIGGEAAEVPDTPRVGFFLISFYVDMDAVAPRLAALGHPLRSRIELPAGGDRPVRMATVVDPDGVLVELIDIP